MFCLKYEDTRWSKKISEGCVCPVLGNERKTFFSACLFSQYITTQLFFFVSIVVSQCYLKIISEQKDSNVHWESSLSFLMSKCSLTIIHNISF